MSEKFFKKGTLLIPSGPSHDPDRMHLFIICNDTCSGGKNLIVPVSSWTNEFCDDTCKLDVGDHPFIRKPSYIFYRKTELMNASDLDRGIEAGVFEQREEVSTSIYLRVRSGIIASPQTKRKYKRYAYDVIRIPRPN